MRVRLDSRLVSLLVAGILVLSLAAPAHAQMDPFTLSLIISGAQLLLGVVTSLAVTSSYELQRNRGPVPLGLPCGMVDGVPQMCWQNSSGSYEGSDVLPYSAPTSNTPTAPSSPRYSMDLVIEQARPVEPIAGQ
jgi:hypothetical protein